MGSTYGKRRTASRTPGQSPNKRPRKRQATSQHGADHETPTEDQAETYELEPETLDIPHETRENASGSSVDQVWRDRMTATLERIAEGIETQNYLTKQMVDRMEDLVKTMSG